MKVGLLLTLAHTKCVEDRKQERGGLRDLEDPWVFPAPSGRPHSAIWNMCGMELGQEDFPPE